MCGIAGYGAASGELCLNATWTSISRMKTMKTLPDQISAPHASPFLDGVSAAKAWLTEHKDAIQSDSFDSVSSLRERAVLQPDGAFRFLDNSVIRYHHGQAGTALTATGIPAPAA